MATNASRKSVATEPPYALSKASNPHYVKGRRTFLQYRELGVTGATGGKLRCQITEGKEGLSEPTGWHVHVCDAQFVYMLRGWLDLEFAGGDKIRLEAGDSLVIPGDTPHNETGTSDEFQLLEVSVPADMGTAACDAPQG